MHYDQQFIIAKISSINKLSKSFTTLNLVKITAHNFYFERSEKSNYYLK